MKAAVLRDDSFDLVIEDLAVADPGPDEVLIKTTACGLCHSDLHVIDGSLVRPRPIVLGHEGTGVVEAVGDRVRGIAVGDTVVTCLVIGCGACVRCERGEPNFCLDPAATRRASDEPARLTGDGQRIGQMTQIGALGEYILMDARGVVKVPASMPAPLAAILGCAVVTGLGSVFNVAKVQPGDTVSVIGCGGVGLLAVQGARIAGAARVVAVDVAPAKLDLAGKLGATDVVDASTSDPVDAVRALTGGGVDHAFEVVGRPATVEQALAMAAPNRTAYAVGILPEGSAVMMDANTVRSGRSLVGVFMGDTRPRVDIPRYVALWEQGKLDLDTMVSQVLPLSKVNEGFAAMTGGEVARTVISF
jgi:S-(hydroxymethyl)glutathione dehydrogenase / alcohol dehydrogenase